MLVAEIEGGYPSNYNPYVKTVIENIGKISSETCINILTKANRNVRFINTEYDEDLKELIIKTSDEIKTDAWYERGKINEEDYQLQLTFDQYIEVIKQKEEDYSDCVTLSEIVNIIIKQDMLNEIEELNYQIADIIESDRSFIINSIKCEYDKKTKEFIYKVETANFGRKTITCKEENGDLILIEASIEIEGLIHLIAKPLKELCKLTKEKVELQDLIIPSDNSNFSVSLAYDSVKLFISDPNKENAEFYKVYLGETDKIQTNIRSINTMDYLNENQSEIFDTLLFRIDDLPEFIKEAAYRSKTKEKPKSKFLSIFKRKKDK